MPAHRAHHSRAGSRTSLWSSAAALLAGATLLAPAGAASATQLSAAGVPTHTTAVEAPTAVVSSAEYHLGDQAFAIPGSEGASSELTGIVHYPNSLGTGRHPVVVILHGLANSCDDRQAWAALQKAQEAGDEDETVRQVGYLNQWPCRDGVAPLASYRGYDYLGERLARQGIVTVSVSADGINAAGLFGNDDMSARAALVNRHLEMWAQLAERGTGPLAGKFTRPGTRQPVSVDFRGRLDMKDIGTIGHSRGGAAVQWHSSATHRKDWPDGVRIKAVLPLASAILGDGTPDQYLPAPDIPFMDTFGTCDRGGFSSISEGDYFYKEAVARPDQRAVVRTVHLGGGNHNFFNTRWSPSSGVAGAADDAWHDGPAGTCVSDADDTTDIPQLSETTQRHALATYATAFFQRYLTGDTSLNPVLNGETHPLGPAVPVEVSTFVPK
ncbi:alpha/beta hydrolase [Streptomyces sp. NPDC059224]|uniref:alpha/beta hydrolase n=1 Tax=Streptomyces sp. NPDC059224 TaxID=3346775 RepID=UPI0036B71F15